MCVEIPHKLQNIGQSIQKYDLLFTPTSFQSKQISNMGGVLLRKTNVLCAFASELAKNQLKSSKMRWVRVGNDTNDSFSFDSTIKPLGEKNGYFQYSIN